MVTLFHVKPWDLVGRRMERNAPRGRRCDFSCTHPAPTDTQALCTVCHEVFGTVKNFDRHRREGWCLNPGGVKPSGLGLRLTESGVWRETMTPEELIRLRTRAKARK